MPSSAMHPSGLGGTGTRVQHSRRTHACLLVPRPPNFGMSRQCLHSPQSRRTHPGQLPQRGVLTRFAVEAIARARAPPPACVSCPCAVQDTTSPSHLSILAPPLPPNSRRPPRLPRVVSGLHARKAAVSSRACASCALLLGSLQRALASTRSCAAANGNSRFALTMRRKSSRSSSSPGGWCRWLCQWAWAYQWA